jgi:hypothetical protein
VAAPDGLAATPADPSLTVDLPTARAVLDAWFPRHAKAIATEDVDRLTELDTGAALAWHRHACGPCSSWIGDVGDDPSFAAAQASGYPVSFLADFDLHTTVGRDSASPRPVTLEAIVVFTRATADDRWKAALTLLPSSAGMVHLPTSADGSIATSAPDVPGVAPRATIDNAAAWMASMKTTGSPPAGDTLVTTPTDADEMAEVHASHRQLLREGLSDDTDYRSSADDDGIFTVAVDDDAAVTCSSIRWSTTVAPERAGDSVVQPADQSRFGEDLAPGAYAEVTREGVRQTCALLDPTCSCGVVLGFEGGVIETDGRRT